MPLATLAALALVGIAVGLLSGLLGIGGGVLIVPFLYFFYAHPDWSGVSVSPELHAAVAHATSLFIIVPTAVRGTLVFHRRGAVAWQTVVPIAASAAVAAVVAARIALALPAPLLKTIFGVLLVLSGLQLVSRGLPKPASGRGGVLPMIFTGVAVGFLSALLGVGGGIVAVPLLVYLLRLDLHAATATSLAIVAAAASAGVIAYAFSGRGVLGLPSGSFGYVHLLAALPILGGSLLAVRWGAVLNQRLDARVLRRVFGVFFALIGLRLIVGNVGQLL